MAVKNSYRPRPIEHEFLKLNKMATLVREYSEGDFKAWAFYKLDRATYEKFKEFMHRGVEKNGDAVGGAKGAHIKEFTSLSIRMLMILLDNGEEVPMLAAWLNYVNKSPYLANNLRSLANRLELS